MFIHTPPDNNTRIAHDRRIDLFQLAVRRPGGWSRLGGGLCCSLALQAAYGERLASRVSPPPRPVCAFSEGMTREFGPLGIHVAHIVIDGGIAGGKLLNPYPQLAEARSEDGLLSIEGIAEMYCQIHRQQRSAWTQEIVCASTRKVSDRRARRVELRARAGEIWSAGGAILLSRKRNLTAARTTVPVGGW